MVSEALINELMNRICKSIVSEDDKLRKRGLKRLTKVIGFCNSDSYNLELHHCLLIWKSLHYWLWRQEKVISQNALVDQICSLLTSIKAQQSKLDFIAAFLETEVREWKTLDKWRMDKFLKLFQRFFGQSLSELSSVGWEWTDSFLEILQRFTISTERGDNAFSLRLHCISIYLEELSKFELTSDMWLKFLQPYFCLVPQMPRDHPLLKRVEGLFFLILPSTEDDDDEKLLNIDFKELGHFLYQLGIAGGKNLRKLHEWSAMCYKIVGEAPPPSSPPSPPPPPPPCRPAAPQPRPLRSKAGRKRQSLRLANGDDGRSPPSKRRRVEAAGAVSAAASDSPTPPSTPTSSSPVRASAGRATPSPLRSPGPAVAAGLRSPGDRAKARKRVSFGKIYRKPFKKKDMVRTPSPGTLKSKSAGKGILRKGSSFGGRGHLDFFKMNSMGLT